jgi:hypothetical protein
MKKNKIALRCISAASAIVWMVTPAIGSAHGFAGKRFFPATLATDDPFVADELSLPTLSSMKTAATEEAPSARVQTASVELSKRITPNFGISLGEEYDRISPQGGDSTSGFGNLGVGLKYQFVKNNAHEALFSAGLDTEIGGTGKTAIGAESFNVYTPGVFFGKGFGDLPEGVAMLRPLALTGSVGVAIPARARSDTERNPDVLQIGLAVEYSLTYLQSFVKDVGLSAPFDRLIPLIEVSAEKPFQNGSASMTGSLYPGVIWAGQHFQLGLEAIVPLNSDSGRGTGVLAQLHFFIDDLFPHSLGRPLVGVSP